MVATFAILVGMVGWAFLIRYRRETGEKIGFELGTALIWVLISLSRPVSLWFSGGLDSGSAAEAMTEGSPINRIVGTILMLLGIVIVIRRRVNLAEFIKANRLLMILLAYCAISICWSDFPSVALKRWTRHLETILCVLVFLTDKRGFLAITTVIRYSAYILLPLSIVLFKYFSDLGRSYDEQGAMTITGVTTGKNSLGLLCMLSALFLLYEIHREWSSENRNKSKIRGDLCILAVAIWILFVCNSETSLLSLFIGSGIYLALASKKDRLINRIVKSPRFFLGVLAFTLAVPLLFSGVGLAGDNSSAGTVVDLTGHSESFWGRTVLWKNVINLVSNPLLGCGYDSFWLGPRLEHLWKIYWWQPTEAHNGFVGVYADLGLVGVAIVTAFFAESLRRLCLYLKESDEFAGIKLAFLAAALFYDITEFAFLGISSVWLLCLLMTTRLRSASVPEFDSVPKFTETLGVPVGDAG